MTDTRFSEREGHAPTMEGPGPTGMTESLRTGVWNVTLARLFGKLAVNGEGRVTQEYHVFLTLHRNFFKQPMDEFEKYLASRREWYKDALWTMEWWGIYDYLEFVARRMIAADAHEWCRDVNALLEAEASPYRLVGNRIVPLSSPSAVAGVEEALALIEAREWNTVDARLRAALEGLGAREGEHAGAVARNARAALAIGCASLLGEGQEIPVTERDPDPAGALERLLTDASLAIPATHAGALRAAFPDDAEPPPTLAEAEFLLLIATGALTYLVRKAEAAGRVPVVPKKELRHTPPDPWGERRLIARDP